MHRPALARAQTVALVVAFVLLLANLAPLAARALTVTASIPVGTTPVGVGVNPETGRVYVANRGSNTVSVIDEATNALIATIDEPAIPTGIAVNPRTNRVYVSNLGRSVAVIDGAANTVLAMVPVGSGAFWLTVNPETNLVYVANFNDRNISVIDGATNSVVATIGLGGGALGIAFNPRTNLGYVANYQSGNVGVIDGATNTIVAVIPTGGTPAAVAVNPETNRVYVTASPQFTVIDGLTNEIITRLTVDGADQIAVNPTTNRIYATKLGVNRVAVIDGSDNTEVGDVSLGTFPAGIDVSSRTNHVYVAKYFLNAVAVITESDLTAPAIASSVSPAPNASGWNNENVTLSWTVSDPESGISATNGCASTTFTTGTEGTVATCSATNGDSLTASRSITIKIDKTPPNITATATTASGRYVAGTWTSQAVTVHYTCSDLRLPTIASAGLASCTGDQVFNDDGIVAGVGTATDNAGNSSSAVLGPILIDRTAPTIRASATTAEGNVYTAATWTSQSVTVHYDCSDALSGIASCTSDQLFSYETSADGTSSAGTASDNARNTASAMFGPIRIDRAGPTITFSGNAGPYEVDQTVAITCLADDTASGIATTTCPAVAAGPATDYVGSSSTSTTTLTATAADNAGNLTTATTSFTVTVTTDGICRLMSSLNDADNVCERVRSIANAPNAGARAGKLRAFDNFLAAQHDRSEELVALLSRLARLL